MKTMEKKLSDYLPLYIGSKVWTTHLALNNGEPQALTVTINNLYEILYKYQDSKLILRPLSDMSEEDAKVITGCKQFENIREVTRFWKDEQCACVEYRWPAKEMVDGYAYSSSAVYFSKKEWTPEDYIYLLSCGFDLFGLIPAGLALDATTLNK